MSGHDAPEWLVTIDQNRWSRWARIPSVVTALQTKAIPIQQSCRLLAVSRSGYYDAQRRSAKPLSCKASIHLNAAFAASHQSYGSRRLVTALENQGIQIGRYKARSLMRQAGLKPVWKRKFIHTTDSNHKLPVADNILARQFNPERPNTAFVTDITYIRTGTGWLYLAIVLDLCSRKVVGWAMAPSMPVELVCAALQMAIQTRQPASGLIVHSDRGSQYASDLYQALLTKHGFVCSMSRKGNCWDAQYIMVNAPTVSWFNSFKNERYHGVRYATHAEMKAASFEYIEVFYNRTRQHSTLGYQSPGQYLDRRVKKENQEMIAA